MGGDAGEARRNATYQLRIPYSAYPLRTTSFSTLRRDWLGSHCSRSSNGLSVGTRSAVGPGDSCSGRQVEGLDSADGFVKTDDDGGGDCPFRLIVEDVKGVVAASGEEGFGASPETLMEGFWLCLPCAALVDGPGPGRELTLPFTALAAPLLSRGDSGDGLAGCRDERMVVVDWSTRDGARSAVAGSRLLLTG